MQETPEMLPLVNRPHLNSTYNKCENQRMYMPVCQRAGGGGREEVKEGREVRPGGWAGIEDKMMPGNGREMARDAIASGFRVQGWRVESVGCRV